LEYSLIPNGAQRALPVLWANTWISWRRYAGAPLPREPSEAKATDESKETVEDEDHQRGVRH
jgi:hypothetical protein